MCASNDSQSFRNCSFCLFFLERRENLYYNNFYVFKGFYLANHYKIKNLRKISLPVCDFHVLKLL